MNSVVLSHLNVTTGDHITTTPVVWCYYKWSCAECVSGYLWVGCVAAALHTKQPFYRDAAMLALSWESYSCPSVCASVCLSITRVLCDKTKQRTADILIPHDKAITLVFWHQQWLVSDAPSVWNLRSKWPTLCEKRRLRQISAYNVSTVGDSQKCSIMIIASWPWAFQWAAKL